MRAVLRSFAMGEPTALDKLQAGVYNFDEFEAELINDVYAGLHRYCRIPDAYQHCELASRHIDLESLDDQSLRTLLRSPPSEIVNPYDAHIKAISLFELLLSGDTVACENGNPLTPNIGAYLYGPPGTGKTHLMAAYGQAVSRLLDEQLKHIRDMIEEVIRQAYARYIHREATEREMDRREAIGVIEIGEETLKDVTQTEGLSPDQEFWATIDSLKKRLHEHEYQPTDLIYIGFKELYETCRYGNERTEALSALENARVVFIDDIHPQGDPEQIQLVLHLLERRYELGRAGTFLTTNLETIDLGGGDPMLGARLLSRCAETLVTVDFTGCDDWRQKVKSRRVSLVEAALQPRIANHTPKTE